MGLCGVVGRDKGRLSDALEGREDSPPEWVGEVGDVLKFRPTAEAILSYNPALASSPVQSASADCPSEPDKQATNAEGPLSPYKTYLPLSTTSA